MLRIAKRKDLRLFFLPRNEGVTHGVKQTCVVIHHQGSDRMSGPFREAVPPERDDGRSPGL
jgi:hypothetical protein